MELVLIWFLFGIISSVVASNKGRSGCGWFLVGVLLGPFGFILALIVNKDQSAIESEAIRSGGMKKCIYCAELIKHEAIVCRFCGKELAPVEIINTPEDCERILLEIGCKMIKKPNGWVIIEPLGEHAAINTFIKTFDELAEYANSKRKQSIRPGLATTHSASQEAHFNQEQ